MTAVQESAEGIVGGSQALFHTRMDELGTRLAIERAGEETLGLPDRGNGCYAASEGPNGMRGALFSLDRVQPSHSVVAYQLLGGKLCVDSN
ncbi:MAG: hypothetical protein SWO11_04345 [Thermodesulfobacteriota bacterium]|nr:hypothetical protein [Thermodesulfobacteriota bacterium]